jgi:hypothetical protein
MTDHKAPAYPIPSKPDGDGVNVCRWLGCDRTPIRRGLCNRCAQRAVRHDLLEIIGLPKKTTGPKKGADLEVRNAELRQQVESLRAELDQAKRSEAGQANALELRNAAALSNALAIAESTAEGHREALEEVLGLTGHDWTMGELVKGVGLRLEKAREGERMAADATLASSASASQLVDEARAQLAEATAARDEALEAVAATESARAAEGLRVRDAIRTAFDLDEAGVLDVDQLIHQAEGRLEKLTAQLKSLFGHAHRMREALQLGSLTDDATTEEAAAHAIAELATRAGVLKEQEALIRRMRTDGAGVTPEQLAQALVRAREELLAELERRARWGLESPDDLPVPVGMDDAVLEELRRPQPLVLASPPEPMPLRGSLDVRAVRAHLADALEVLENVLDDGAAPVITRGDLQVIVLTAMRPLDRAFERVSAAVEAGA